MCENGKCTFYGRALTVKQQSLPNLNDLIGGERMSLLNEYSYIWEEDRDKYVLVTDELGESIFYINGKEIMFFLIEDDMLDTLIINKMLENGNRIYKSIEELQASLT